MFRQPHIKNIKILNKQLPVHTRGYGAISLVVVGQASLFKKPNILPSEMDKYFTMYFVDLFEKRDEKQVDYSSLTLDDFISSVENTRIQLGLEKVAIFGHSAAGILAIEYAKKYKENVLFNLIISTAPIWGDYKKKLTDDFFNQNSTSDRQNIFAGDQKDQNEFEKESKTTPSSIFVRRYNSRRAHFYYEPKNEFWQHIWDGVNFDEDLINRYFETIKNYDFRNVSYKDVATFLCLGMFDYSAAFYGWTDEAKAKLNNMEYYIFDKSGHYPMVEQRDLFMEKLLEFIDKQNVPRSQKPVIKS